MQQMSGRLSADVTSLQHAVLEGTISDVALLDKLLMTGAKPRRNAHIFPEDEATVNLADIAELTEAHAPVFGKLPAVTTEQPDKLADTSLWVIGDFDEKDGYELLQAAAEAQKGVPGLNIILINNPELVSERPAFSTLLYQLNKKGLIRTNQQLSQLLQEAPPTRSQVEYPSIGLLTQVDEYQDMKPKTWYFNEHTEAGKFWRSCQELLKKAGFKPGQRGLVINGRVSTEVVWVTGP